MKLKILSLNTEINDHVAYISSLLYDIYFTLKEKDIYAVLGLPDMFTFVFSLTRF